MYHLQRNHSNFFLLVLALKYAKIYPYDHFHSPTKDPPLSSNSFNPERKISVTLVGGESGARLRKLWGTRQPGYSPVRSTNVAAASIVAPLCTNN